jgi:hypothetical protein
MGQKALAKAGIVPIFRRFTRRKESAQSRCGSAKSQGLGGLVPMWMYLDTV